MRQAQQYWPQDTSESMLPAPELVRRHIRRTSTRQTPYFTGRSIELSIVDTYINAKTFRLTSGVFCITSGTFSIIAGSNLIAVTGSIGKQTLMLLI